MRIRSSPRVSTVVSVETQTQSGQSLNKVNLDRARCCIYNIGMNKQKSLAEELDKMAAECLAVRVRMMNRAISALYDECLRPFGLRVNQGNILVAIVRREPVKPAEICRFLRIEKSTFSRDVDVLRRNGWLESDPPEGGRTQTLRVTKTGHELLRKTLPVWAEAQKRAKQLLGESGVEAVHQIADRIGFNAESK
jgi:DNA-binding MarR family transcriptional regulator